MARNPQRWGRGQNTAAHEAKAKPIFDTEQLRRMRGGWSPSSCLLPLPCFDGCHARGEIADITRLLFCSSTLAGYSLVFDSLSGTGAISQNRVVTLLSWTRYHRHRTTNELFKLGFGSWYRILSQGNFLCRGFRQLAGWLWPAVINGRPITPRLPCS